MVRKLSNVFAVGKTYEIRKVVLLIEKRFGIRGLFIVSFIHTLSPHARPILPRY